MWSAAIAALFLLRAAKRIGFNNLFDNSVPFFLHLINL
jgi:hypothetical protein